MKTAKQTERTVLDKLVTLMDSAVRIPGTNIRFGLDALIGLIPGVGDASSLIVSGGLILMMAKKGITAKLAIQMLGNVAIDYLVGSIPLLGDLFDVGFKANEKNLKLLKDYHKSSESSLKKTNFGSILLLVVGVTILFVVAALFVTYELGAFLFGLF